MCAVEEDADLTWVYILGGFIGANLILCILFIYCRYRIAKQKEQNELQARAEGKIVQSWGIRTTNVDIREREIEKTKSNAKNSNVNSSIDGNSQFVSAAQLTNSESNISRSKIYNWSFDDR